MMNNMDKEMLQNNLYAVRVLIVSLSIDNANQFNLTNIDKEILINKLTKLENNLMSMIGD